MTFDEFVLWLGYGSLAAGAVVLLIWMAVGLHPWSVG